MEIEHTPRALSWPAGATKRKSNAPQSARIKKVRFEIIPIIDTVFFCWFSS